MTIAVTLPPTATNPNSPGPGPGPDILTYTLERAGCGRTLMITGTVDTRGYGCQITADWMKAC